MPGLRARRRSQAPRRLHIRSASRALVLLATLIAIPFLVAQALAGLKGGRG
jgi:hypothetical protein